MDIDNGQGTKMPTQAVAVAPPPAAMPTSPNDPAASPSTHSYGTRPSNKATTTSPEDGKMSAFDQKWFSSFNKLKSIIRPDGSLDYSALDDESQKSMRNFVKVQRKSFRKREADEPSPMTDERYKMLVDAKFNFKPLGGSSSKLGDTKPKAKKQKVVEEAEERPNMPFSMPPTLGVGDQSTPMKVDMLDEKKPAKEPAKKTTPKPSPKPEGAPSTKKKNRSPTTTSTSRKSSKSGKPTYLEMVHEAIVSLKDRTGSSTIAISKWIQSNYDHTKPVQANMFKSRINLAIKTGVKDGRFAKIKNSYKINSEWTKKQKAAQRSKEAARKKQEKKREALMAKAEEVRKEKAKEKALTPEERVILKKKAEQEERKKKIEALKKKRRFPMEDTLLHNQEKEWGERPPAHVTKRPALPYTMTSLVPPNLRANMPKKYHGREHSASASGEGPLMGGENERGLITDAMSVWNFFCGDVGLVETQHPIPKFSFKTLLYALDEVLSGNAKTAKALPPLITHLFVTALKMLTGPRVDSSGNTIEAVDSGPAEARLLKDIAELNKGLNAISWSQVCFYYMDLMDQFFSSDTLSLTSHATAYLGERVLKPTGSLDMSYLWNEESSDVDNVEDDNSGRGNGYLGSEVSTLHKAFTKLENQTEPWSLKADELMSILRALCDDILIRRPELADDIAGRGAKLHELSKAKRAAMVKYNKVRVALEGPKKSTNLKKGSDGEETKEEEEESKPFVPTATKQQLDAACKALIRAEDAYDNGVTKLISQTEPVAFDRNFNAVYFFRSDPTMLHFELLKQHSTPKEVKNIGDAHVLAPQSTWHVIDTKPLFEQFLSSLDKRGKRENDLLEHLNEGLGRKLQDDKHENSRSVGRERERQGLLRRIENARSACDGDDGRRSGRLANNAMEELETLEGELKLQTQAHEEEERQEKLGREAASDYNNLTGLNKVAELFSGQRKTRSIRKKTDCVKDSLPTLADVPPHKLWMDKSIGGNGTLHILAGALLELETKANELAPWSREDKTRDKWRSDLTTAVNCWTVECEMKLGPNEAPQTQQNIGVAAEDTNPYKKQRTEAPGAMTTTVILNTLKTCLKDLELRVFEISGNKRAIAERAKAAVYEDDSSEEENVVEGNDSWKIKINALRRVPTHRYGLIRDIIVAAMTVARRSHLSDVARELKTVLQLVRPQAAGMAKNAAIEVLDNHGGYEDDDEDDDNINIEQFAVIAKKLNSKKDQDENVEHSSMLNDEVRIFSGCLGADLSVDSSDWTDAVKETRSISRLALMIQCFLANANETLVHLTQDRKSLDSVLSINARRTSRNKKSYVAKSYDTSTPVWANCTVTDKLVRAKVKGFPWWAASVAEPVDSLVADGLAASKHKLIVSVGSPGMFLVADKNIVDFAEETEDDITQYDKDIVEGMQDSLNIAKKLWRSRHKGMKSPWKKSKPTFPYEEEKKSDI